MEAAIQREQFATSGLKKKSRDEFSLPTKERAIKETLPDRRDLRWITTQHVVIQAQASPAPLIRHPDPPRAVAPVTQQSRYSIEKRKRQP